MKNFICLICLTFLSFDFAYCQREHHDYEEQRFLDIDKFPIMIDTILVADINPILLNEPIVRDFIIMPSLGLNDLWNVAKTAIRLPINKKEQEYFKHNPVNSIKGAACALNALTYAGSPGTKNDAIRHCVWASCLATFVGEQDVAEILNNHETNDDPNSMDNHNNRVGRQIFAEVNGGRETRFNRQELIDACYKALEEGRLKVDIPDAPPKPSFFENPIFLIPLKSSSSKETSPQQGGTKDGKEYRTGGIKGNSGPKATPAPEHQKKAPEGAPKPERNQPSHEPKKGGGELPGERIRLGKN